MAVAVPVISTNEDELLRHALPTVLEQDDVDVVVIDNASEDSTAAVAAELGVRSVRLPDRHSWPRAANAALRATDGDPVLFMQPDCFLEPGFVAAARRRLEEPGVGSVAPKLVRTLGPGRRLDAIDAAGMSLDRRRKNGLVGHGRPALGFARPAEAFGADGAVALYRRAALDDAAVEGQVVDEQLEAWGSDADLAWRLRVLGWRCVYEPEAIAFHVRTFSPSTRGQMPDWDRMVQFRNRLLMMVKNDPVEALVRDLPTVAAYELGALGYALLVERALLRGYVEAARMLPDMRRKRRIIQRRRTGLPPYGLEPPV